MNEGPIDTLLQNYKTLLERVDAHIEKVEKQFPGQIACKKGCDACCKFLTLFPVEALAISAAFSRLSQEVQEKIIERIDTQPDACPLLIDNACALYPSRPVICRTHGYPIFMEKGAETTIDFCPENFKDTTSFPKNTLLSIEQLNATLIAVNQHFLEWIETDGKLPERISISDALFMINEMQ